jgi:nicotinamide mononucleotide transporter
MDFFNINTIAFEVLQYPVSYIELVATLFGLLSVYYATQANILTWSTGLVNVLFLFLLFYQIQLYPDMFLQVYFFVVTMYGWYHWKSKSPENKISILAQKPRVLSLLFLITGSLLAGLFFSNIHLYWPQFFKEPASFPYIDSFVMVASIIATILLARKNIESWYLWISIDIVCTILYYQKEVYFLSLEYLIFLVLASYGCYHWKQELTPKNA